MYGGAADQGRWAECVPFALSAALASAVGRKYNWVLDEAQLRALLTHRLRAYNGTTLTKALRAIEESAALDPRDGRLRRGPYSVILPLQFSFL